MNEEKPKHAQIVQELHIASGSFKHCSQKRRLLCRAQEAVDPIFSGDTINALAHFYAGTEALSNPLLSPLYADLHGFPPLRIDVGRDEVLFDDALLIVEHARAADVPVELTVWDEMWHVFQQFASVLPEGQQSLEQMGSFLHRQMGLPPRERAARKDENDPDKR